MQSTISDYLPGTHIIVGWFHFTLLLLYQPKIFEPTSQKMWNMVLNTAIIFHYDYLHISSIHKGIRPL